MSLLLLVLWRLWAAVERGRATQNLAVDENSNRWA